MHDFDDTRQAQAGSTGAILSVSVTADAFDRRFGQCGRLVDYMAKYAAIYREDIERGAMMFSAVWNGALEAIAKNHAGRGAIELQLRHGANAVELGARIPVDEAHTRFWRETATLLGRPDLNEWYRAQMERGALDCDIALLGLAEIVATFRAQVRIAPSPAGGAVGLTVVFPLSEMEES